MVDNLVRHAIIQLHIFVVVDVVFKLITSTTFFLSTDYPLLMERKMGTPTKEKKKKKVWEEAKGEARINTVLFLLDQIYYMTNT